MAPFDEYGDESEETSPGLTLDENGKIALKPKTTAESYNEIASDNSAVDAANKDAGSKKMWAGVIQGLSQAFAGPKNTDSSFYDGLRADQDNKVTSAKSERAQKLSDLLTQSKLKRQDVTDGREDTEFKWKGDNVDPNSPKAVTTRAVMSKKLGVDPKAFDGLGFDDTLKVAKQLQDFKEAAARAASGGDKRFQQSTILMPDGTSAIAGYDTATNTVTLSTMTNTGGNATKAYAPKYDATTGSIIPAVPGAVASPVTMPDGSPLSDVRTGLEGERAYVKGTAKQQVTDEQAVQDADANVNKVAELEKSWTGLYDKAAKEGMFGNTGPIAGKAASAASKFGIDMGDATNQADPQITREASNYIREQSGLSSTDSEFKRLMSTIPTLGVDREVFVARMKAWQEDVARAAEKARAKAAPVGGQAPAAQAAEVPPPSTAEVERKDPKSGRTAVYDATTKAFLRWKE